MIETWVYRHLTVTDYHGAVFTLQGGDGDFSTVHIDLIVKEFKRRLHALHDSQS